MARKKADITTRFLQLAGEAIAAGQCKNRKEFAAAVGEHAQNLTSMEKGIRSPTLEQVARACEIYGYSPTWLILGVGARKMAGEQTAPAEDRITKLEAEVAKIKKELAKK